MDFKFLKWQLLRGSLMRRVVLRAFMLVLAVLVVSLMQMVREIQVIEPIMSNMDECPLNLDSDPSLNFTKNVFIHLMEKNLLQSNASALCIGERSNSAVSALHELGFRKAFGVNRHPSFSLLKRRFVYELEFEDNYFDFVFSGGLERVSIPALLVLELERVLRPGGTGAILLRARKLYSGGSVRLVTPVASFLKRSDIVHACNIVSFTLVIFKKRFEKLASFEHFKLPDNCPSFAKNKPFMKYIEPIKFEEKISYLPNFMNISSRNKLVYINVGAGEFAKKSVAKLSKHYCSNHHSSFEVFVIDHNTSVLSSYVMEPGITFVYLPELSGNTPHHEITSNEHLSAPMDEENFEFVRWFDETVSDGDFVVLMMNAELMELNILVELFTTGAICRVDELFLRCLDGVGCKNLLESLRKSGIYVHQWFGD